MGFDSFVGNRKIIDRLQEKLRQDRFPHGLLFSGPSGIGKQTCAIMVAKALNCTSSLPGDFCGECTHCRKIDSPCDKHACEEVAAEIVGAERVNPIGRLKCRAEIDSERIERKKIRHHPDRGDEEREHRRSGDERGVACSSGQRDRRRGWNVAHCSRIRGSIAA